MFKTTLAAAMLMCVTSAVRAAPVQIFAPLGVTAAAGSTGNSFDVLLINPGGNGPVSVAGFTVDVATPSADNVVTITNATDATTAAPYVFQNGDLGFLWNPVPNLSNSSEILAGDVDDPSRIAEQVSDGGSVGLVHVIFSVDASAQQGEVIPIVFDFSNPGTSVTGVDNSNNSVSVPFDDTIDGSIVVRGVVASAPLPASSGCVLGCLGLFASWTIIRRRRVPAVV